MDALIERDPSALAAVVEACVRVKAQVVVSDPEERGPRRALTSGTPSPTPSRAQRLRRRPPWRGGRRGPRARRRAAEATCGAARALTERTAAS